MTESLEVGGAERVVVTLANALAREHQVSVVCLKQGGALAQQLSPSVPWHAIGKREGADPAALVRLVRLLRRERPDVIHTHDWGVFLDAMLASRLSGTSVNVHTVHGLYMTGGEGSWARAKRGMRHFFERRMAGRAHIVCVSEDLRRHVAAEVGIPLEATRSIANGVAVEAVPPEPGHADPAAVVFIAVCRLAPVKNLQLMIRAFADASRSLPAARLVIVGDGPERGMLEQLAAGFQLGARISFLGFRTDTDPLIRGADVMLLSSLSEGIPMSLLEAMTNGRAVIATEVGGVPALVEHGLNGLLVPAGDEAAFSNAIQRLASDGALRKQMGNAGHARARGLFGMEKMVSAYEALYRERAG
ncbi:MAG TPA: glycosyltransferase family 4 protein [Steroidobacteraceae bacterium]|nr:glycosyltransferase family 4 protein [Steroidobacteraceae bacterium]